MMKGKQMQMYRLDKKAHSKMYRLRLALTWRLLMSTASSGVRDVMLVREACQYCCWAEYLIGGHSLKRQS